MRVGFEDGGKGKEDCIVVDLGEEVVGAKSCGDWIERGFGVVDVSGWCFLSSGLEATCK